MSTKTHTRHAGTVPTPHNCHPDLAARIRQLAAEDDRAVVVPHQGGALVFLSGMDDWVSHYTVSANAEAARMGYTEAPAELLTAIQDAQSVGFETAKVTLRQATGVDLDDWAWTIDDNESGDVGSSLHCTVHLRAS